MTKLLYSKLQTQSIIHDALQSTRLLCVEIDSATFGGHSPGSEGWDKSVEMRKKAGEFAKEMEGWFNSYKV